MTAYILDASVAAKWFLPAAGETLVDEALELFQAFAEGEVKLSVPDLFWPEFGNIMWNAARLGRMTDDTAAAAVETMAELKLQTSPSLPLLSEAFSIASTFQRTVYDSIYVAQAVASNRPLVTADERLANALAAYFPVRWLGTLS